jgi:hypothetical protein
LHALGLGLASLAVAAARLLAALVGPHHPPSLGGAGNQAHCAIDCPLFGRLGVAGCSQIPMGWAPPAPITDPDRQSGGIQRHRVAIRRVATLERAPIFVALGRDQAALQRLEFDGGGVRQASRLSRSVQRSPSLGRACGLQPVERVSDRLGTGEPCFE